VVEKTGLGTIVDFNDIERAAQQFLSDWTEVASEYAAVRRAAMQAAAAYRWPDVSARYEKLYQSALGHDSRAIHDVPILVKTADEAIELLDEQIASGPPGLVVFANGHTLNTTANDAHVRSVLVRAIVFNDGIGVDIASWLLFGKAFPENLNGTDFVPRYLRQSRNRYRIYLLGAKPGVAERAAKQLILAAPGHEIVGTCHGYYEESQFGDIIKHIRRSRADILLVAMGNPIQEAWLNEHLSETGCRLGFGVGGLFDFLAGEVPRAPLWVQTARVEWAYRLIQQPTRLWRRYLIQMPIFLARVGRQWLTGARVPGMRSQ
jgi:alpha-1,3-mannosyltransferase